MGTTPQWNRPAVPYDSSVRAEVTNQVQALHALLDAQMIAMKDNLEGVHRAIEAAPTAQKEAVNVAMAAAEKAVNAALLAAKSAVDAAAFAHAREHELMAEALRRQQDMYKQDKLTQNEWRATVTDLAGNKMDAREVRSLIDGVDLRVHSLEMAMGARLKTVEEELATTRGVASQTRIAVQSQMWVFTAGMGVLSLIIAAASVALAHLWK